MTVKHSTLYVRDQATRRYRRAQPQEIITTAEEVITQIFCRGTPITGAAAAKQFFVTKLACKEAEVFGVMFLNNKHELLAYEELFTGTIDSSAVYPREIAKRALFFNAAAILVSHNHPSGHPDPSRADQVITNKIREAMALIDVRLLDHVIVGGANVVSLAEQGII